MEYICSYQDVDMQLLSKCFETLLPVAVAVMTHVECVVKPRLAHTVAPQTPLLHKYRHTFDILHSLFPRHSLPVVLQATVGGGEDLGMKVCEMYASGNK